MAGRAADDPGEGDPAGCYNPDYSCVTDSDCTPGTCSQGCCVYDANDLPPVPGGEQASSDPGDTHPYYFRRQYFDGIPWPFTTFTIELRSSRTGERASFTIDGTREWGDGTSEPDDLLLQVFESDRLPLQTGTFFEPPSGGLEVHDPLLFADRDTFVFAPTYLGQQASAARGVLRVRARQQIRLRVTDPNFEPGQTVVFDGVIELLARFPKDEDILPDLMNPSMWENPGLFNPFLPSHMDPSSPRQAGPVDVTFSDQCEVVTSVMQDWGSECDWGSAADGGVPSWDELDPKCVPVDPSTILTPHDAPVWNECTVRLVADIRRGCAGAMYGDHSLGFDGTEAAICLNGDQSKICIGGQEFGAVHDAVNGRLTLVGTPDQEVLEIQVGADSVTVQAPSFGPTSACTPSYEGPSGDIQVDGFCMAAWNAQCSGLDQEVEANCRTYDQWGQFGPNEPCPYCSSSGQGGQYAGTYPLVAPQAGTGGLALWECEPWL